MKLNHETSLEEKSVFNNKEKEVLILCQRHKTNKLQASDFIFNNVLEFIRETCF